VGLQFASTTAINNYAMHIGQIALTNSTAVASAPATNMTITSYMDCNNAELRVLFDTSTATDIAYYNVYRVKPNGVNQWLGMTTTGAYYVKNFTRIDNEATTQIAVVAVNSAGVGSTPLTQTITWPANAANDMITLDGFTKYLKSGIVNLSGSGITLEGWIKPTSLSVSTEGISAGSQ
jgi:hypothetical protein